MAENSQSAPPAKAAAAKKKAPSMKEELLQLKRERILDAAAELFLQHGYHRCTLDAVAKELGFTKSIIYYQYKDKSQLLAAICGYGANITSQLLEQTQQEHSTPTEQIRWFCQEMSRLVAQRGTYLTVYLHEVTSLAEQDRKAISRIRAEIDDKLTQIVEHGVQSGEFHCEDVVSATRAMTGMISISFQWYRKELMTEEQFVERMTALAMKLLK